MVRLIAYNIEYCEGIAHTPWEYLKAAHFLRSPKGLDKRMASYLANHDPDILGLLEVDTGSVRSRRRDETTFFAESLGFNTVVKTNKYDGTDAWHRFVKHLPIFKHQDNAVLTRLNVENATFHTLSKGLKNVAIEVTVSDPEPHTVLLVHLALFKSARRQQLNDIKHILRGIETPVILCGDFNTFNQEELNDLLETTRLHDAYAEATVAKEKTAPTWNPAYRLDNVLHTPEISVDDYTILGAEFSDHLPVKLDYSVSTK